MFQSASMSKMREALEGAKNRLARVKEKAEQGIETTKKVVEVAGASGAMGYVNGKWGETAEGALLPEHKIAGVPTALGLGGVGLALSLFGAAGKYDDDISNIASGCLGQWSGQAMLEIGMRAKQKGNWTGALPQGDAGGQTKSWEERRETVAR